MDIIIKKAKLEDLETIQHFGYQLLLHEKDNWDNSLESDWPFSDEGKAAYTKAIQEKYTIIATANEKPVGYLIGSIRKPKSSDARQITTAQLENIYVDSDNRGHGIGEKLARAFQEHCISNNVDKISVTVNAKNEGAINFYKKIGLIPSRIILSQSITNSNKS